MGEFKIFRKPLPAILNFPKLQDVGGSVWDYSATSCLFNEEGVICSDIHGNALDLNRPDATFMNHRGIIYASNRKLADKIREIYSKLAIEWITD